MQPGDVQFTYADTALIEELTSYKPNTSVTKGVKEFVNWYKKIP